MKLTIPITKPRNPLVAMVKFRKGGSHAQNKRVVNRDQQKLGE